MAWKNRIVELRQVPAADLKANPRNFRRHPERQSKALRGVLREVGIAGALLAYQHPERGLELIDGHLRQEQGGVWPVLVLDVTEAEAAVLLATHDPITAMAEQDSKALADLVQTLDVQDAELRAILEEMAPPVVVEPPGDPEHIPEAPAEPITKPGDLWTLGKHRLLCGDSESNSDFANHCSTLIFDPPWDIPAIQNRRESTLAFCDGARAGDVIAQYGSPTWIFVWDCVSSWYTPNRPLRRTKLCLWYGNIESYNFDGSHYGDSGESRDVTNTRGSYKFTPDPRGKHLTDLFQAPITKLHSESEHSHSKPIDWIRMLIANCTQGDIYDPFCGSGTTIIAAEQLNRTCYAMEISPQYCDVIVKRWEQYTGQKAVLEQVVP